MKHAKFKILALTITLVSLSSNSAFSEVFIDHSIKRNTFAYVEDDGWQPELFETGIIIPATHITVANITLDGRDNEPVWNHAIDIPVPLKFGTTKEASLKALYTGEEVFIRVRWKDETENREHHPWIWKEVSEQYTAGPQIEDSIFLSFEAGCEWTPSLLDGYVYDFDGWKWMAARSDPLGQAVDMIGTVQDQDHAVLKPAMYQSRGTEETWHLKFEETATVDVYELHANWNELDRVYLLQPIKETVYIHNGPDNGAPFAQKLAPPKMAPIEGPATYPQYSPLKLEGPAGEVSAKGHWEDGYWTVEFRRDRVTPARTLNDTVFNRITQFSIQVYDQVERVDQASESGRLLLQFLPPDLLLVEE
jgi:hypothetical protein